MKTFIYFAILASLAVACTKEKAKKAICDSVLLATAWNTDSTTILVDLDSTAGSVNHIHNLSIRNYSHMGGAFNSKDGCYYIFQEKPVGYLELLKFNVVSKKTEVIPYSGVFNVANLDFSGLIYNKKMNKLYCVYYVGNSKKVYEIIIANNSCHEQEVLAGALNTTLTDPMVDDNTGNMYFRVYEDSNSSSFVKMFNPQTKVYSTVTATEDIYMQFSSKDNMIYGIKYEKVGGVGKTYFIKIDPRDGSTSNISNLNIIDEVSSFFTLFDVYSNRFVVCKRPHHSLLITDMYWLDPATGSISKHTMPNEPYWSMLYIQCQ